MEKSTKIVSQVYGYAICLVTVITFLISTTALVNALIDLTDPIHSGWTPQGSPSLASYEIYKQDILKTDQKSIESNKEVYIPNETTIRSMYEAAKSDKIQTEKHQALKSILISSLIIVICLTLFLTHWSWMRRIAKAV